MLTSSKFPKIFSIKFTTEKLSLNALNKLCYKKIEVWNLRFVNTAGSSNCQENRSVFNVFHVLYRYICEPAEKDVNIKKNSNFRSKPRPISLCQRFLSLAHQLMTIFTPAFYGEYLFPWFSHLIKEFIFVCSFQLFLARKKTFGHVIHDVIKMMFLS